MSSPLVLLWTLGWLLSQRGADSGEPEAGRISAAVLLASDDRYEQSLGKVMPVLEMAQEDARLRNLLPPGYYFHFIPTDDRCIAVHAQMAALAAYREQNVTVFFGPACEYCVAIGGMADADQEWDSDDELSSLTAMEILESMEKSRQFWDDGLRPRKESGSDGRRRYTSLRKMRSFSNLTAKTGRTIWNYMGRREMTLVKQMDEALEIDGKIAVSRVCDNVEYIVGNVIGHDTVEDTLRIINEDKEYAATLLASELLVIYRSQCENISVDELCEPTETSVDGVPHKSDSAVGICCPPNSADQFIPKVNNQEASRKSSVSQLLISEYLKDGNANLKWTKPTVVDKMSKPKCSGVYNSKSTPSYAMKKEGIMKTARVLGIDTRLDTLPERSALAVLASEIKGKRKMRQLAQMGCDIRRRPYGHEKTRSSKVHDVPKYDKKEVPTHDDAAGGGTSRTGNHKPLQNPKPRPYPPKAVREVGKQLPNRRRCTLKAPRPNVPLQVSKEPPPEKVQAGAPSPQATDETAAQVDTSEEDMWEDAVSEVPISDVVRESSADHGDGPRDGEKHPTATHDRGSNAVFLLGLGNVASLFATFWTFAAGALIGQFAPERYPPKISTNFFDTLHNSLDGAGE